jgi:hypothetical protein
MSFEALVLAIGPFSRELRPHLHHPSYDSTDDGVTIVVSVFDAESTSQSELLADCFGIDPWNFNQHELHAAGADLNGLRTLFGDYAVRRFLALRDSNFRFFYIPEL